jgi:hypothetical protein
MVVLVVVQDLKVLRVEQQLLIKVVMVAPLLVSHLMVVAVVVLDKLAQQVQRQQLQELAVMDWHHQSQDHPLQEAVAVVVEIDQQVKMVAQVVVVVAAVVVIRLLVKEMVLLERQILVVAVVVVLGKDQALEQQVARAL